MGTIVAEQQGELRVLAIAAAEMQTEIRRRLRSVCPFPVVVGRVSELAQFVRNGEIYQVALLPAHFPDGDWWTIWGEIALLNPKPTILVYAQTADFQLWSGVLEAGGYDVIAEPLTDKDFVEAVMRAAMSFSDRSQDNAGRE